MGIGITIEEWLRLLLLGFVILIPVYLLSTRYISATGQASVRYMVLGKWSPLFWIAVVFLGMVIPMAAVISSFALGLEETPAAFIYVAIISGLLGDLAIRYLILRCGLYNPLLPFSIPQTTTTSG